KVRQPRSQIGVGDTVRAARTCVVRLALQTENEMRAGKNRLERGADSVLKPSSPSRPSSPSPPPRPSRPSSPPPPPRPSRPPRPSSPSRPSRPVFVERHQPIDLTGAERTTIGLGAETGNDLPCACALFGRERRPAAEHFLPARRVGDASDPIRPL